MKIRYLPGILLCLLFAVTISGCGSGGGSGSGNPTPVPTASGLPDLVVTVTNIIKGDTTILYTCTIKNIGSQTVTVDNNEGVKFQNYFSADTILNSAEDVPAGGWSIQGVVLAPGDSYSGQYYTSGLTTLSYLIVELDIFDAVKEANENNNTCCVKL